MATKKTTTKAEEKKAEAPAPAPAPAPTKSEGSEIAAAITQGLANANKARNFTISVDDSVVSRYSVVKNKAGEIMLRENETGQLTRVQLRSIEEQEAALQDEDVEEV